VRFVWLERLAIAVASLALAFVLIALVSGYFTGKDQGAVNGGVIVGYRFADQGDGTLPPGYPTPLYDSDPPTSGPHRRVPVLADDRQLSSDEILTALAAGNVVVLYGTPRPPAALTALAGGFTPQLAAAGLAVILAHRPGSAGLIALSWTRMLKVASAGDPLLREFVQEWLGGRTAGH
jgi:Protein of unknown function (DUF3105)